MRGVSDGDALRVAALRLLKPKPLELVRAAHAVLAGPGGQAHSNIGWVNMTIIRRMQCAQDTLQLIEGVQLGNPLGTD